MTTWRPLSEAQISEVIEKAIPMNTNRHTKKATKFNLGVFQDRVFFFNIVLRLNFTIEAEIATQYETVTESTSEFVYRFQNTA